MVAKLGNKLKTLEAIVGLYKGTEFEKKARLNHANIVLSNSMSKSENLEKYIKEKSITDLNSYLNFHNIKLLFIKQKIKRLLKQLLKINQ